MQPITEFNNDSRVYYQAKYSSTPSDIKDKVAYTVKKGDNLWNIAQKHINKPKATNAEVQEMMYSIAKLNNKNSIEQANHLEINDTIYLPGKEKAVATQNKPKPKAKSAAVSKAPDYKETAKQINVILEPPNRFASYNEKVLHKLKNKEKISKDLYAEHGRAGIAYWENELNHNDNLYIEKSYTTSPNADGLVITKKENNDRYGRTESNMVVRADKNGKFKKVAFYTPGAKINDISFDFEINAQGTLTRPNNFGGHIHIENLTKEQYSGFTKTLQGILDKNLK